MIVVLGFVFVCILVGALGGWLEKILADYKTRKEERDIIARYPQPTLTYEEYLEAFYDNTPESDDEMELKIDGEKIKPMIR